MERKRIHWSEFVKMFLAFFLAQVVLDTLGWRQLEGWSYWLLGFVIMALSFTLVYLAFAGAVALRSKSQSQDT